MLIDIADMMSTELDIPFIFLAEAALSRNNEVGIVSRAPKASPLPPLGSPSPWFTRSVFLKPLLHALSFWPVGPGERLVYII